MIITRNDYNTMPEQVQENKDNINLLDNAIETAQTEMETSKPVFAGIVQSLTPEEQARARSNIGAGASGFSGDYNDLVNQPIENADLNNIVGETAGHTYRHTGTTNATFVKGYLYFWTGTAWKLISNFNDLKQAQDDIALLNSNVQTIDNDKANKDTSNLTETNVKSWNTKLREYISGHFSNGIFSTAQWGNNDLQCEQDNINGDSLSISSYKVNILKDGTYKIAGCGSIQYNGTGSHGMGIIRTRSGTNTTLKSFVQTLGGNQSYALEMASCVQDLLAGDIIFFVLYTDGASTMKIDNNKTNFIVERIK